MRSSKLRPAVRGMRTAVAVLTLLTALSSSSWASVGPVELKELVAGSDLIVVVTITKVEDGPRELWPEEKRFQPVKIATAQVVETWKGTPVKQVRFVASPTWQCDITGGEPGERSVLFLERLKGTPVMRVLCSGRGQVRLRDMDDGVYAETPFGVILPKDTTARRVHDPEAPLIAPEELARMSPGVIRLLTTMVVVEVGDLKKLVGQIRR